MKKKLKECNGVEEKKSISSKRSCCLEDNEIVSLDIQSTRKSYERKHKKKFDLPLS